MIQFLIVLSILLPLTSLFIVAWYNITRHYIVINPDNTESVDGYIFKHWSVFFDTVYTTKVTYYIDGALKNKLQTLQITYPKIAERIEIVDNSFKIREAVTEEVIYKIESALQVSLKEKDGLYFLYIEELIYLIPDIIRKPFSACVKCMASVYGGLIWCAVNYFTDLFFWTNHDKLGFFFFGFIFCVILSQLNSYIWDKFN